MYFPQEFFDVRHCKRSDRSPDFKHKYSGQALWLNAASQELLQQVKVWDSSPSDDDAKVIPLVQPSFLHLPHT